MKSLLTHFLASLGVSYLLRQVEVLLGSDYIGPFLKGNIITIILTLLAINTATLGIVLTKIREILDRAGSQGAFAATKKEMLLSVYEQVALVFVSLVLLMISDSSWVKGHPDAGGATAVALGGCFVYAILVLLDTAKSVFIILDVKNNE